MGSVVSVATSRNGERVDEEIWQTQHRILSAKVDFFRFVPRGGQSACGARTSVACSNFDATDRDSRLGGKYSNESLGVQSLRSFQNCASFVPGMVES